MDTEDRTRTKSALNFDRASVRFCNPSRDREAQPNTTKLAGPGFIGSIKAVKNLRQVVAADADSGIPKLCYTGAIALREANRNRSSCWCVLYGIIDQNEEKPMQSVRIALDEKLLGVDLLYKCQVLRLCQNLAVLTCTAQALCHINNSALHSFHSGIGSCQ